MPTITYIQPNGTARDVAVPAGDSVMWGAVQNDVQGIVAECGGTLSCATCHVYVDPGWYGRLPPPSEDEVDMLDNIRAARQPSSRLSCQITVTAALDGLVVTAPDVQ